MSNCFIVSFDGGGVKFVLELVLLRRILEKFPTLESKIKLVAGTSAGGLIAGAIATKGFKEAYKLLMTPTFMSQIFSTSYRHSISSVAGWNGATYRHEPLYDIARSQFTENDVLQNWPKNSNDPHLLITSFCISRAPYPVPPVETPGAAPNPMLTLTHVDEEIDEFYSQTPHLEWCPRIYHTFHPAEGHGHIPLIDIWMQTTSAPTYFPSWKGCCDGGVVANNPAMLAYTTAVKYGLFKDLATVRILSFGTGVCPMNMDAYPANADLGKMQWLPYLSTLFVDANTEITVVQCMNLLGPEKFHRVQPVLPRIIGLEEYTAYTELCKLAEEYDLTKTFEWLEKCL